MGSRDKAIELLRLNGEGNVSGRMLDSLIKNTEYYMPPGTKFEDDKELYQKLKDLYAQHEKGLESVIISAYVRNYSDDELDAMIKLYKSPAGSSILSKMDKIRLELGKELIEYENTLISPAMMELVMERLSSNPNSDDGDIDD